MKLIYTDKMHNLCYHDINRMLDDNDGNKDNESNNIKEIL